MAWRVSAVLEPIAPLHRGYPPYFQSIRAFCMGLESRKYISRKYGNRSPIPEGKKLPLLSFSGPADSGPCRQNLRFVSRGAEGARGELALHGSGPLPVRTAEGSDLPRGGSGRKGDRHGRDLRSELEGRLGGNHEPSAEPEGFRGASAVSRLPPPSLEGGVPPGSADQFRRELNGGGGSRFPAACGSRGDERELPVATHLHGCRPEHFRDSRDGSVAVPCRKPE